MGQGSGFWVTEVGFTACRGQPAIPSSSSAGWLHLQSQSISTSCPPAVEAPRCALCHACDSVFCGDRRIR